MEMGFCLFREEEHSHLYFMLKEYDDVDSNDEDDDMRLKH